MSILNKEKFKSQQDILLFTGLLLCAVKLIWNLDQSMDLLFDDEPSYLFAGLTLKNGLPDANDGPLYSLWYFILNFFTNDAVSTMYLNIKILSFLSPLLLFWLLRRLNINLFWTFIFSFLYLISLTNLPMLPKVSNFMNVLLLFSLLMICITKEVYYKIIIALSCVTLGTFVRPEFKLAIALFSIWLIIIIYFKIKNKIWQQKHFIPLSFLIGLFCLLFFYWGNPFKDNTNRTYLAFIGHFTANYLRWNNLDIHATDYWEITNKEVFNNANSMGAAIQQNPTMVVKHLAANTQNYIGSFSALLLGIVFPSSYMQLTPHQNYYLLFLLLVILTAFAQINPFWFNWRHFISAIKQDYEIILIAIIFLIPTLISVIMISPRWHYLVLQIPSITIILVIILPKLFSMNTFKMPIVYLLAVAFMCILLTPSPANNKFIAGTQPQLSTIRFIQSMKINKPIIAFDDDWLVKFVNKNNVALAHWEKSKPFYEFLKEKKINLILVTIELQKIWQLQQDRDWNDFLLNYSTYNFKKIEIPNSKKYLLVNAELLN